MQVIYKYRIPFMEVSKVVMPADSQIIRIDGFDGSLWLWAIVNTDLPLVERTLYLYKTGGEMRSDIRGLNYLGCGAIYIQMELMMYIFEVPNSECPHIEAATKFDWIAVQKEGEGHAI